MIVLPQSALAAQLPGYERRMTCQVVDPDLSIPVALGVLGASLAANEIVQSSTLAMAPFRAFISEQANR